jgi:hypothetical protein
MPDTEIIREPSDAIHGWFGLTYANYLVLPRTLLQSMPDPWQEKFVGLLGQLDRAFDHIETADAYQVHAGTIRDLEALTLAERRHAGITRPGGGGKYYDADGDELDRYSTVVVPCPDPVPHYRRGRTRIEPKLNGETDA